MSYQKVTTEKQNHHQKFDGLNVLQICGLQHHLHNSPLYDQWFPVIVNTIESFIRETPSTRPQVSYEEVMQGLIDIMIDGQPLELAIKGNHWINEEDNSIQVEEVVNKLKSDEKKYFIEWYVVSKRYFSDDLELLRTV